MILPIHNLKQFARIELDGLTVYPFLPGVFVNGKSVKLSWSEYSMLMYLLVNIGTPITTDDLAAVVLELGGGKAFIKPNRTNVWCVVRRLREKIEPDPNNPRYILTDRKNHGYYIPDGKEGQ